MDEFDEPDSSAYPENGAQVTEASHACNSCRRRKLRCSRERPTCQHCRKAALECWYEAKRAKPGMKAGALDNIHKRLDLLERLVAKQQSSLDVLEAEPSPDHDSSIHTVLSSLAAGIQSLNRRPSFPPSSSRDHGGLARKRRRIDDEHVHRQNISKSAPPLPDDAVLSDILESYFIYVHPWMPIIHEGRLRRRLEDDVERDRLYLVIHAMTLVACRYIEDSDTTTAVAHLHEDPVTFRDWLVSQAMKDLSVENLQALIIITSDDIGNGQASHAWPLVGSLSRMVEYLQLTVEHDEAAQQYSFCQPYKALSPPKDWTEAEERRRIFWSIFALDRFCSVSMGWNTSLTSDDVRRRLPCDGVTWRKEDPVVTPYLGIWDKSASRIGKPIPAYSAAAPPPEDEGDAPAPSEAGTSPGAGSTADMSTVGAFAYCIEATESLSRVTSYFLQQKVNMKDQREFSAWLTRFKELDLRLVHWKMLLPQKWSVNVVQQAAATSSRMDPNLTVAHVTHNASMILLHQPIAFPLPDWPFKSRLPSVCSMDTCQAAAIEVAEITSQYLKTSLPMAPLSSQFAFCVFIAARSLLLYWQHSSPRGGVVPEFWVLIQTLDAMASRWVGMARGGESKQEGALAGRYSATLVELHRQCSREESFVINISGYTSEIMTGSTASTRPSRVAVTPEEPGESQKNSPVLRRSHPSSTVDLNGTHRFPLNGRVTSSPAQATAQPQGMVPQRMPSIPPPHDFPLTVGGETEHSAMPNLPQAELYSPERGDSEDLVALSQMLLDQQFTGMDRVISYSDGLFESELEGQRW